MVRDMLIRVKRWAVHRMDDLYTWIHRPRMHRKAWLQTSDYQAYLEVQLKRTIQKKDALLSERSQQLIDRVCELVDIAQRDVLCVGARTEAEILYFLSKGAPSAVGIDLFSNSPLIQVMDMHRMDFPEASFDLIYSCHSLEHAYDPGRVIEEIRRVSRPGAVAAIEVPIRYETRGADRIDFQGCRNLLEQFRAAGEQVLYCRDIPAGEPPNTQPSAVAQAIFVVK